MPLLRRCFYKMLFFNTPRRHLWLFMLAAIARLIFRANMPAYGDIRAKCYLTLFRQFIFDNFPTSARKCRLPASLSRCDGF